MPKVNEFVESFYINHVNQILYPGDTVVYPTKDGILLAGTYAGYYVNKLKEIKALKITNVTHYMWNGKLHYRTARLLKKRAYKPKSFVSALTDTVMK